MILEISDRKQRNYRIRSGSDEPSIAVFIFEYAGIENYAMEGEWSGVGSKVSGFLFLKRRKPAISCLSAYWDKTGIKISG
jgi:hypothetical protein